MCHFPLIFKNVKVPLIWNCNVFIFISASISLKFTKIYPKANDLLHMLKKYITSSAYNC